MAERYDISYQRPSSRVTPGGFIEKTYDVTFVTKPSGITGTVEIPLSQYNADNVHKLVDAQAINLEAVAKL